MLKALELVGFKSFADKTRFEFGRGITAVVGPNGSGKSNVVDAIKWVLGEQSAKSLRGKEMADVIFNGSGSRRGVNCAEVTLTFDNSSGLLPLETPDVHITRRVYRSGEGEYLINRQPSRLRDIRDLFMGTGASTEAYSVIEQGKVDGMLQSSPKERREIFEEAAGISRFKSKKLESLRRLERVDQNLLRLADIVEEVENQLKAVRAQAGKAQKYQELSERLQTLRTQVGWADWRKFSGQLATLSEQLETDRQRVAVTTEQAVALDAATSEAESRYHELHQLVQASQRLVSDNHARITSSEATIELERTRGRDLEEEIRRQRGRLTTLTAQAAEITREQLRTRQTVSDARSVHAHASERVAGDEEMLSGLTQQIDASRKLRDQRQLQLREQLRSVAQLAGEISSLESQVEAAMNTRRRSQSRLAELETWRSELELQRQQYRSLEQELESRSQEETQKLTEAELKLQERRSRRADLQAEISQLRGRHTGTAQRIALLEDLEKRHEGVSPGVKQVLQKARSEPDGPYGAVRGLVADLLQVSVETAPLIEVALGEAAQQVVVAESKSLIAHLKKDGHTLPGRVGFLRLDHSDHGADERVELQGQRGVIGRADRFVETTAEFAPLATKLLGNTWIVESFAHALTLANGPAVGCQLITLAGELLAADGTLFVGQRSTALGLISRRSELRELRAQFEELAAQIAEHEIALARLDKQVEQDQQRVQVQAEKRQAAADELSSQRQRIGSLDGRLGQLAEQCTMLQREVTATEAQHAQATSALGRAHEQLVDGEARVNQAEQAIATAQEEVNHLESRRALQAAEVTTAKIELAKSEERLLGLQNRLGQLEQQRLERQQAWTEAQNQIRSSLQRQEQAEGQVLRCTTDLAQAYLDKESLAERASHQLAERETLSVERTKVAQQAQAVRNEIRTLEERLHRRELESNQLIHQRTTLVERLRDDYGIDVTTLEPPQSETDLQERTSVEREIEDLRKKLGQLGNVNLDALVELNELDSRFTTLAAQHKDLTEAKQALEQIIQKINLDSRRLFLITLDAIRGHFQGLFRKLFGGGQADIILEEGAADVLDCGIDIVARPPGKELRNISLMSGGEKTMTCVALLLSIFKNRPSPFCVLDEVDAALDEANNERLVNVLSEFASWTQFIVVTHSKKTMTCATTLYGVTMQESGISKRVSVRFEDVSDGGNFEVSPDAEKTEEEAA